MALQPFPYEIPSFRGYSALENRAPNQFSVLENWTVRTTSLTKRKGCTQQIGALTAQPERLYFYRKKNGSKYLLTADGTNLRKANSGLTEWESALKSDCNNAKFGFATIFDNCYMGNGYNHLKYDGATLSAMTGANLAFNLVIPWGGRLLANITTNPTFFCYSDVGDADTLTGDNYWRVANDSGDPIKAFIPILSHLLIVNQYSAYGLYGTSPSEWETVLAGSVGTVSGKTVVKIGETAYWLSQTNVVKYAGSQIQPFSLELGDLSQFLNMSYIQNSVAIGYDDYYWLAVPKTISTTNNMVLLWDTISQAWSIFTFPFSIYDFAVDDNILYCLGSDKKLYKLNTGTTDAGTPITATFVLERMKFGAPGRKKKCKTINFELADLTASGTLDIYLRRDDLSWDTSPASLTIPDDDPGEAVPLKVSTRKFYFLSVKGVTTADLTINNMAFDMKASTRVK